MSTATSPDARYFTSDVEDGVHYPSSDGKPMAETGIHVTAILLLYQALEDFFRGRLAADAKLKAKLPQIEAAVAAGELSPARAVDQIVAAMDL